ncbi:MAG: VirB3 family type IV secretion system protein [Fusobacterium sp.]
MAEKLPEDWNMPVCEALIKPILIAGVSREAFIMNITGLAVFVLSLKMLIMIPFFVIIHIILVNICKKDSQIINIFMKRYVKQQDYFYEG